MPKLRLAQQLAQKYPYDTNVRIVRAFNGL